MVNVIENTPTPNMGLMMQPSGRNRGIWGDFINEVLLKIDSIMSTVQLSLTGGSYVMVQEEFDLDQTTSLIIEINGALVSNQTLVFPQMNRPFFIVNNTTGPFTLTATTGSGQSRVIAQGGTTGIRLRGSNIEIMSTPVSADGVVLGASQFANITVTGQASLNNVSAGGNVSITGTLGVQGVAQFQSITAADATFSGAIAAAGASIGGTTTVNQLAANSGLFSQSVDVGNDLTVADTVTANTLAILSSGSVAGNFTISGTLNVAAFSVTNFSVSNLEVTNDADITSADITTLNVIGTATLAADPVQPLEAATKQYVDALASGIQWKAAVRVGTTANIALTGTQTIDGVGVIAADRVLVKNQTNPVENGIWVVSAGAWTRSTDADSDAEINGMVCFITEGTANGGQSWIIATSPATIAGPKTYVLFSGNTATVDWTQEQW